MPQYQYSEGSRNNAPILPYCVYALVQSNLAKQLAKLVKVKYVENITDASRVGRLLPV